MTQADSKAIRELVARYNRCFDDGDAEGFASTFTEDGVMEVEGGFRAVGRHQLEEMCRRTPYGTVHVTVDAVVDVHGESATHDCTLLVLSRPKPDAAPGERTTTLQRSGRYHDELVRTEDGWRLAKRTCILDGGL